MSRRVLPARFPPGQWPAEMCADTAAAYMDYSNTKEFFDAVARGDAPRPTSLRGAGKSREPIWAKGACDRYIALRNNLVSDEASLTTLEAEI